MTHTPGPDRRAAEGEEPVEELADEAKTENPDPTTARETFELELMEEGRSEEGESVELTDEPDDPSS
ncbi:MAG TPA: hypothetical protein VH914_14475 [Acidimicrobiia bacterium]|nr:hypothetical protein [Acidimicrobiia bacterium]